MSRSSPRLVRQVALLATVLATGCYTRLTHPRADLFQAPADVVVESDSDRSAILGWYYAQYGDHCAYYLPWIAGPRSHDGGFGHPTSPGGPAATADAFGRGGRGEEASHYAPPHPPHIEPADPGSSDSTADKPNPPEKPTVSDQKDTKDEAKDRAHVGDRGGRR